MHCRPSRMPQVYGKRGSDGKELAEVRRLVANPCVHRGANNKNVRYIGA